MRSTSNGEQGDTFVGLMVAAGLMRVKALLGVAAPHHSHVQEEDMCLGGEAFVRDTVSVMLS